MSEGVSENRRILVIDDNRSIHDDYRKVLTASDASGSLERAKAAFFGAAAVFKGSAVRYEIDSAYQGQEGVAMARAAREAGKPYALAFVDMRMPPGWDGLETIEHLWEFDSELQVVICTAYSDHPLADIIRRLGQTDRLLVLKKPFDNAEVQQLASAMTEKWRLNRQAGAERGELERLVESRTAELRETALRDRLTGLWNRQVFLERVADAIERVHRESAARFGVLFVDLDHFKSINDSLGHSIGDEFLVAIAERLKRCLGPAATIARFGGDEFLVLLQDLSSANEAIAAAQRLLAELSAPYVLGGHQIHSGASIGVTSSDFAYERAEDVVREADFAMYAAKTAGKGRVVAFTQAMRQQAVDRFALACDLREEIARQGLFLHYQPIVSLRTGVLSGVEALVRWNHPQRGMLPPDSFIPIAEETGLIIPLGEQVLATACRQLAAWRKSDPFWNDVFMSVNLSRRQLAHPALEATVRGELERAGIAPGALHLEITESSITSDPHAAAQVLENIRQLGVALQVDDFGIGQSSLSCLHQFPLSGIKIDRAFLRTATERRDYAAVIHAIVSLAHNLGMQVIAEGVETADQIALLQAMDCDAGQGFLFGRPAEPETVFGAVRRCSCPWEIAA